MFLKSVSARLGFRVPTLKPLNEGTRKAQRLKEYSLTQRRPTASRTTHKNGLYPRVQPTFLALQKKGFRIFQHFFYFYKEAYCF
ncbi:hypothetical protein EV294_103352 [Paenibacillus sp. BK033]|nr:hypothetical protein EV294_103352 [Paenibacillus sp. BK033]